MPASGIYAASVDDGPLRQGEILSDLVQFQLAIGGLATIPGKDQPAPIGRVEHPFAVVISQDCDLDQGFRYRVQGKNGKEVTNVLLCELHLAAQIRDLPEINRPIWDRVKINRDERYHFLEKVPGECDAFQQGLQEIAVDFKRCFSIPTPELYFQLKTQAKRRCRLISPYLEHFSQRVFQFHSRIGLPEDHHSEPVNK